MTQHTVAFPPNTVSIAPHTSGQFIGQRNVRLFYQCWTPKELHGLIVLAHGYGEHTGRYAAIAAMLNAQGYAVWAPDQRGHGRSEGLRAHVHRFADFVADFAGFVEGARAAHPDLPLFVLGHSMGGLIATLYALEHPGAYTGLILSGPAVKVDQLASPLLLLAAGLLSALTPTLGVIGGGSNGGICRDPDVVTAFNTDPLCYHGKVRARMGYEMLRATQTVLPRAGQLTAPVLVVQGEADRIIPAQGVRDVFAAFGSADKTLHVYPGLYHEVMSEPERETVMADILHWLNARSGATRDTA